MNMYKSHVCTYHDLPVKNSGIRGPHCPRRWTYSGATCDYRDCAWESLRGRSLTRWSDPAKSAELSIPIYIMHCHTGTDGET